MKRIITMLILTLALCPNKAEASSKYTLYGYAYNMTCSDCDNKFVEIYTDDGNIWHMTNVSIKNGQRVKLRMDSKGTANVTDDVIVKMKIERK